MKGTCFSICHCIVQAIKLCICPWMLLSRPWLALQPLMPGVLVQEIRRIWVGYLSQCDPKLGQKVAQKLQSAGAL